MSTEGGLTDPKELLFRQVHPAFMRDGRPSSQAFKPTRKDQGKLSVSRSSMTTPEDAFAHHTVRLGFPSAGTWAVSVEECSQQDLLVYPDPILSPPEEIPDPSHAFVEFSGFSGSQVDVKGVRLARAAHERGCLFPG